MAELATIARPYAEALFKTGGGSALAAEIGALGAVAADEDLRQAASIAREVGMQGLDSQIAGLARP